MSGVRFPQPIRLSITLLQIIQMAFGTAFVAHNIIYCNFNPLVQYAGKSSPLLFSLARSSLCSFNRIDYVSLLRSPIPPILYYSVLSSFEIQR